MEVERAHNLEHLKKVHRTLLFENRLDTFKRLGCKGTLESQLKVDVRRCIEHAVVHVTGLVVP